MVAAVRAGSPVSVRGGSVFARSLRAARYAKAEHVTLSKAAQRFGVTRSEAAEQFALLFPHAPRIAV